MIISKKIQFTKLISTLLFRLILDLTEFLDTRKPDEKRQYIKYGVYQCNPESHVTRMDSVNLSRPRNSVY